MIEHIRQVLQEVAEREQVRVLLAVESGSRAWGFASPDSDWDVRFVYVRRVEAYLSIAPPRDVIEAALPNDVDLAGWDLPKALRLFAKSNPALLEWIRSPIVYATDDAFIEKLRRLEPSYISLRSGMYHYRSMSMTNFRTGLQDDLVKLKKYLYVVRPLLACRYLERTGQWPPVPFRELIDTEVQNQTLRIAIEELLAKKAQVGEIGVGPRIPTLDEFIVSELDRLDKLDLDAPRATSFEPLDELFRSEVLGGEGASPSNETP